MSKESMKMMKMPKKQLTFAIDLNKCTGCQTCTVACKRLWTSKEGQDYMYWRNVETAPGLGYPKIGEIGAAAIRWGNCRKENCPK